MTSRSEDILYSSLTDIESLERLAKIGLDPECIPTEEMRPMVAWALDTYFASGRRQAPSREMLLHVWGQVLEDIEVVLIEEDTEVDIIESAIDNLKDLHAQREWQTFIKTSATDMANASPTTKVETLTRITNDLFQVTARLQDNSHRVDGYTGYLQALADYDIRAADQGRTRGMVFGIEGVDQHTYGIHEGEQAILASGPKVGKALEAGSRVLTPSGWREVQVLVPGDLVMGSAGPTRVLGTARWSDRPLMRVTADDGGTVLVDAEHDWTVRPHSHGRREQVVDTQTLMRKIVSNRRFAYLPMPAPVTYESGTVPTLDPYLLGLLLGDGGMTTSTPTFTSADEDLHRAVEALVPEGVQARDRGRLTVGLVHPGRRGNALTEALRALGVMGCRSQHKFVPEPYIRASVEDRLALLQGLMDTDGGVDGLGVTYCSTSPRLARQVQELVWSLGGTARMVEKPTEGLDAHVVRLRLSMPVFRLRRKLDAYRDRGSVLPRPASRRIVEVAPAGVGDTVCIQVDAPDSLFITEDFLLTHNSYFLARVALHDWAVQGHDFVLYTLENTVQMTMDRIVCLHLGISPRAWQRGQVDKEKVAQVREFVLDEMPSMPGTLHVLAPPRGARTPQMLIREAKMLGVTRVAVDQLTHVENPDPGRKPRHELVSENVHEFADLIKDGRDPIALLVAHQINREGVKAAAKQGYLEMVHLAESAGVERAPDWVFGLFQSSDERVNRVAKFQTLAARREDIKNWQIQWDPETSRSRTLYELALG